MRIQFGDIVKSQINNLMNTMVPENSVKKNFSIRNKNKIFLKIECRLSSSLLLMYRALETL